MKHTPGPWVSDNTGNYSRRWVIRHNGLVVAEIRYSALDRTNEDAYANADLIAAAPDLLDALRLALPYIEKAYECSFPDYIENDYVLDTVRAAIAKAEGKE